MCFSPAVWHSDVPDVTRRRFVEAGLKAGFAAATLGWAGSAGISRFDEADAAEVASPSAAARAETSAAPAATVLKGARIYPSPDAPPITRGILVMRGVSIAAVGSEGEVSIPADATVVDCTGLVLTAAFWN